MLKFKFVYIPNIGNPQFFRETENVHVFHLQTSGFFFASELTFSGYSYKSKEELMSFIGLALGQEFMPANYDSVSHNCNHFSSLAAFCLESWVNLTRGVELNRKVTFITGRVFC